MPLFARLIGPIFICFFCFQSITFAQEVRPLDVLKIRMNALDIPADLQEEWIESLEKYEDRQDSPQFKEALAEIDEKIKNYLVNGDSFMESDGKKRKKKKGFLKNLGRDLDNLADKISKEINKVIPLEVAKIAENNNNYEKAIRNYKAAIVELDFLEKYDQSIELSEHVAELYEKTGNSEAAIKQLEGTKIKLIIAEKTDDLPRIEEKIKKLQPKEVVLELPREEPKLIPPPPPIPPKRPAVSLKSIEEKSTEIEITEVGIAKAQSAVDKIRRKAEQAEREKDFAASQKLNKDLLAMKLTLAEQEKQIAEDKMLLAESQSELSVRNAELVKQQAALEKQKAFKRNLWIGLGLLAALAGSLYLLYFNKRRDHQKLGAAYKKLATAQSDLKNAEKRITDLLKQQLSGAVANELIAGGGIPKMEQRFVCIMFLDIRNFTPFVEKLSPEEIIDYQNNVLGFMIEKVIERHGIVNTILGDGFMATFGAPTSVGNDCLQAHRAATEIMEMVKQKSESGEIPPTKIGIGLHAGYVIAGNVGTKDRKQYSITGNPVIIASRLEQLNKEYKSTLIVSKEVFEQLPEDIEKPDRFDSVVVKGRSQPVEIAKFS